MGQKTNPISNRIGITRGWDSNWCGGNYAEKIAEDFEIRKYLNNRLAKASLSRIIIERTLKLITVTIYAARPGFIIGKGGTEVDKLKEELKKVTKKDVQINIFEVKKPEVDAHIVADSIARQIEGRVSYRRAIKMAVSNTMRVGAEGIKIQISGRVGGAEMARNEMYYLSLTIHFNFKLRLLSHNISFSHKYTSPFSYPIIQEGKTACNLIIISKQICSVFSPCSLPPKSYIFLQAIS